MPGSSTTTIGEGCNARTFVFVAAAIDALTIPQYTTFYVGVPGLPVAARNGDPVSQQLQAGTQPSFIAMQDITLYVDHNRIHFYTWGASDCCLPKGATAATLSGSLPNLAPGDVLIFEEVLGPLSGEPEDADPNRRCAVRLDTVTPDRDPLTGSQLTEISWGTADALPFPVCVSSTTDAAHGSRPVGDVSVARGNITPADHGVWARAEQLGTVPPAPPTPVATGCNYEPAAASPDPLPRFYPALSQRPLTFATPFAGVDTAAAFLVPDHSQAKPVIELLADDGSSWDPERDLLGSHSTDRVFVPEIEFDGTTFLRFGDGQLRNRTRARPELRRDLPGRQRQQREHRSRRARARRPTRRLRASPGQHHRRPQPAARHRRRRSREHGAHPPASPRSRTRPRNVA